MRAHSNSRLQSANNSHLASSGPSGQRPILRKQNSCQAAAAPTPSHHQQPVAGARALLLRRQASVDQGLLNGGQADSLQVLQAVKRRPAVTSDANAAGSASAQTPDAPPDRINLNIFLSPTSQPQHSQDGGEPSDSERDSSSSALSTADAQQRPSSSTTPKPPTTTTQVQARMGAADGATAAPPPTAADRRAAFQATSSKTLVSGAKCTVGPPPLIRAMSAPVRSHDDSKQTLAKRRLSRRRCRPQRDRSVDGVSAASGQEAGHASPPLSPFYMDRLDETHALSGQLPAAAAAAGGRSRSAMMGGRHDVVTLVSLLSSGDEEEDSAAGDLAAGDEKTAVGGGGEEANGRMPTLRKTGKSVSFQESGANVGPVADDARDDFPLLLRRGSIAPLAARLRANRPPTAPPGSIYLRPDYHTSAIKSADGEDGDDNADDCFARTMRPLSAAAGLVASASTITTTADDQNAVINPVADKSTGRQRQPPLQIDYPAFCRSGKERECWSLFQKMLQKGVNVSYETIMRGMLTPTELRSVLKQRNADEERQRQQLELKADEETGSGAGKPASGNAQLAVRCS